MLKKVTRRLKLIFTNYYSHLRRILIPDVINADFIILDDFFPNPLSDWRIREFEKYLNEIPNTKIGLLSNSENASYFKMNRKLALDEYLLKNPEWTSRIFFFHDFSKLICKHAYCLFFNNLKKVFPYFERNSISFSVTLYPGGGFKLYDKEFDLELDKYLNSSLCKKIIVNMPHVYDYLLERICVDKNKLELIYGVPIKSPQHVDFRELKNNDPIKILFISHKYMDNGLDKGFDIVNSLARKLECSTDFQFTVAGGFHANDVLFPTANIEFISELDVDSLHKVSSEHDIVLSPNRPFVLSKGAFDGFPTGSVMHAALAGCLILATDDFDNGSQIGFIDGTHYYRISTNVSEIINNLMYLNSNRKQLKKIACSGRKQLELALDLENQMPRRLKLLNGQLYI